MTSNKFAFLQRRLDKLEEVRLIYVHIESRDVNMFTNTLNFENSLYESLMSRKTILMQYSKYFLNIHKEHMRKIHWCVTYVHACDAAATGVDDVTYTYAGSGE